jgi:selenocysteine-specific elongation factor
MEEAEARAAVAAAMNTGSVVDLSGRVASRAWLSAAHARLQEAVAGYLGANPLRSAAPREHVRSTVGMDATTFDALVVYAGGMDALKQTGKGIAPPGYEPRPSAVQAAAIEAYLDALRAGGYSPPTDTPLAPDLLAYVVERGQVVDMGRGVVFDAAIFAEMLSGLSDVLDERGEVTLAEVRDLFGTSRKYAQAVLEYLDSQRITRRVGDAHVAAGAQGAAR